MRQMGAEIRRASQQIGVVAVAAVAWVVAMVAWTSPAAAFCGAYVSGGEAELFNNATQVVMMRDGKTTVMSMQNNYEGPPEDFAMIVPAPEVLKKENVKTLEDDIFEKVDRMTAPRLVEYWERDPCEPFYQEGGDAGLFDAGARGDTGDTGQDVKVEAEFSVGEYDIVVLSSDKSAALEQWLTTNGYNIPKGAAPYLEPYVQEGAKFFVAKVNTDKVQFNQNGQAVLSPLRFHYESDEFKLPVRLGLINSKGTQDLIVNILAREQRYNVANYPNATIPTNLHVVNDVRNHFSQFYRALFRETLKKNTQTVGGQTRAPVVTEYAWNAGSCDPCPGPTLKPDDYLTLGADVIVDAQGKISPHQVPRDFVITRLHARYQASEVGRDLVFQKAPGITGGRGGAEPDGKTAKITQGRNNFQGRYIIRHPWDGDVDCSDPQFGRWGGQNGGSANATTAPGPNTRGGSASGDEDSDIDLSAELHDDVDELDIEATPGGSDDGVHNGGGGSNEGRACSTVDSGPVGGWWLIALAPVVCVLRRRRG